MKPFLVRPSIEASPDITQTGCPGQVKTHILYEKLKKQVDSCHDKLEALPQTVEDVLVKVMERRAESQGQLTSAFITELIQREMGSGFAQFAERLGSLTHVDAPLAAAAAPGAFVSQPAGNYVYGGKTHAFPLDWRMPRKLTIQGALTLWFCPAPIKTHHMDEERSEHGVFVRQAPYKALTESDFEKKGGECTHQSSNTNTAAH